MRRKKKFFWGLLLFMVLFLSGCSKNDIVIKNNIILRGKEKKLYLIADEDIVCNNIHDVWIIDDYVYGWFYSRENKYMMFIFDVSTKTIQIDNEAKNKINELKLPLNNWTDYSEIFGKHITNSNRRNMFFQNIDVVRRKNIKK